MQYFLEIGGWAEANMCLKEYGGLLFDSKHKHGNKTVTAGNKTFYFWEHLNGLYADIQKLASELNYDKDDKQFLTTGKLARWYLKDKIDLPYQKTYWDKSFLKLAKDGYHWHYLYARPGNYKHTIELDLKSAYATSLLSQKSLLYSDRLGYMKDNGAIEVLRKDVDRFPKFFRLILIGILSQYKMKFYTRDKTVPEFTLKYGEKTKIEWNAAFNAAHRAILRIYKLMETGHKILGDSLLRAHTDSFLIDITHPDFINNRDKFFALIKRSELKLTCKAAGEAFIKDSGLLVVGKSLKGSKPELIKFLADNKIKMKRLPPSIETYANILESIDSFSEGIFND